MDFESRQRARGDVVVNLIDKDGNIVQSIHKLNHLVNWGKHLLAKTLLGETGGAALNEIRLGTDNDGENDETLDDLKSKWRISYPIADANKSGHVISSEGEEEQLDGIVINITINPTQADLQREDLEEIDDTDQETFKDRAPIRELGLFYSTGEKDAKVHMFSRVILPNAAIIDQNLGLQVIWTITFLAYTKE